MKVKITQVLQLSATSINPILGLMLSLISVCKKSVSPLAIAVSIALIFCYFPLMYDVSHSFFSYIDFIHGDLDNQLHALNEIANLLNSIFGLDYYYVVFFTAVVSLYLWFKMFTGVAARDSSLKYYSLVFLLFLFAITYKETIDLNRSYISYMVAIYAIFNNSNKNNIFTLKVWALFLISFYLHASSLVIPIAYVLSGYVNFSKRNGLILLGLSLFLGATFGFLLNYLIVYIPQGSVLSYLISENWGIAKNINIGRVLLWSVQVFVVASLYFISEPKGNNRFFTIFILLSILFLVFVQFRVFGERFFIIVVLMMPLVLINIRKSTIRLYILLLALFIKSFSYNIYLFGYIFGDDFNQVLKEKNIRYSIMIKPMLLPTSYLLSFQQFGYSDKVIEKYSTRREFQ